MPYAKKYEVKVCERWYEHKQKVESADVVDVDIKFDIVKTPWDVCIQADRKIEHRRPDIKVMQYNNEYMFDK